MAHYAAVAKRLDGQDNATLPPAPPPPGVGGAAEESEINADGRAAAESDASAVAAAPPPEKKKSYLPAWLLESQALLAESHAKTEDLKARLDRLRETSQK